jgi:hypothetical protein
MRQAPGSGYGGGRLTEDLDFFLALERKVWEALKAGDIACDRALLADDFLGVYDSGFGTKHEHVAQLHSGPVVADYSTEQARLKRLTPTLGLLSYKATWHDHHGASRAFFITSIWAERDGKWVNIFSQDTSAGAQA